jgi:hypothetical protein
MGAIINPYKVLDANPEEKRPRSDEDNINTDLKVLLHDYIVCCEAMAG